MTLRRIIRAGRELALLSTVERLLSEYPEYTALLTVRKAMDADVCTRKPHDMTSRFLNAKDTIYQVDLGRLSAVQDFSSTVAKGVEANHFGVTNIAHVALVLRLIGIFSPDGDCVTLISSDAHHPGKNPTERIPPVVPKYLDLLVKPKPTTEGDTFGLDYQRYANSKLALTA
ncbi:hypothetical protein DL764_000204 [Monosporascus ibericus]|uniref:Uncharacterized protein n=1 Tax=Monosporascus ibericus TaxID=155417 RepID=A0A4Q4TWK3_9PEZI|nr:hypothetical protein DL764_000204 [Monosporascus ibericus]